MGSLPLCSTNGSFAESVGESLPPSILIPAKAFPPDSLLVLLHGTGGNATTLRVLADAWGNRFPRTAFLLPGAPVPAGLEYSAWYKKDDQTCVPIGIAGPADSIAQQIRAFQQKHDVPTNRVAFLGHSLGSSMATWMALQVLPETCLGVVMLNGNFNPTLRVSDQGRQVPILFCAGTKDEVIPIERQRSACADLSARGAHVQFKEFCNGDHELGRELLEFVEEYLRLLLVTRT